MSNKSKIMLALSTLVLIIVCMTVFNENRLTPSNVGNIHVKEEPKEEYKAKTYPKFVGEEVKFGTLVNKELIDTENGLNLFLELTSGEIIEAFNKSTEELGFDKQHTSIEENIKFNSKTQVISDTSLMRSLTSTANNGEEKLEVSLYTNGKISKYAYNLVVDVRAEEWNKSNKILETFLNNLDIDKEIKDAILKTKETYEDVNYTDGENGFNINVKRNNNYCCNTSVIITHNNVDKLVSGKMHLDDNYENVDELLSNYNMIKSTDYEYSFDVSEKPFGKDVTDVAFELLNRDYVHGNVEVVFKGIKGADGTIYNEELNYINRAYSADGEFEVIVASNYVNGSISHELDINSTNEELTAEELEYCQKLCADFINIVDEECEITDVKELKGNYSKNTVSLTKDDGSQYVLTYGEIDNALMINHSVTGHNTINRSSDFNTYK